VFNLSGSEVIFLVLIALVVLGPDKLPDAMRRAGKAYADFKKMTTGFQNEMKSVLDEPLRELRETADLAKKSAMFDVNSSASTTSVAPTNPSAPTPNGEKPVSGSMADDEPVVTDEATSQTPTDAETTATTGDGDDGADDEVPSA
jgi:sec-independent protein translocase protein TatB